MPAEEWVTLVTTNDEVDVHLKKGLLEESGIACIVESSIYRPRSVAPLYNQFKLNVKKGQLPEAEKILREVG